MDPIQAPNPRDILTRLESRIAERRHFTGCQDYHLHCAAADEIRTLRRERAQLAAALDGYLFESGKEVTVEIGERRPA